ncbi:hypothetical protein ZEAMMB73_Zm00001d044706 [Zea mays]|uniref:Uncharacterized protein n=1 Tax=Zea mays TaxID=4577 RepID=A0A1D6NQW4_MAIZE|nr:hypothetical protein ZEAMMB73_Zm00001d044706 [Zea mays]
MDHLKMLKLPVSVPHASDYSAVNIFVLVDPSLHVFLHASVVSRHGRGAPLYVWLQATMVMTVFGVVLLLGVP